MKASTLFLSQAWGERASFALSPSTAAASYQYSQAHPKACFHPLVTPKGHVISGYQMSDHIWHRGLWFTIKLINDSNFWEEDQVFGSQLSKAEPKVELLSSESGRITHFLAWTSEKTGTVLEEQRSVTLTADQAGSTHLFWDSTLVATKDLKLDRTPFTTWGGYGGFSFRAARELHNVKFNLPGGETVDALTGQAHDWVLLHGQMDGGKDEQVSMGMIDHPANPRSKSPWYAKSANGFTFVNAAFLFHEPMDVKEGEKLRFRYQFSYRDGRWSHDEFQALAQKFQQQG